MRRISLLLLVFSALMLAGAAAAFADTAAAAPAQPGWLQAAMEDSFNSQVPVLAQKEVGHTVDQLKADMGPTDLMSPDGKGGTYYFYQLTTMSDGPQNVACEWYDVDSSGKVVSDIVNIN